MIKAIIIHTSLIFTLLIVCNSSFSQINPIPNTSEIVSRLGLPPDIFYLEIYNDNSLIKNDWKELYNVGDTVLRVFSDTLQGLLIEDITIPFKVYLSEITFSGDVIVDNAVFENSVILHQAVFQRSVNIKFSEFNYIDFWAIEANSHFFFINNNIKGFANFKNAVFKKGTTFHNCKFNDRVSFLATFFVPTENVDFSDVLFEDYVNFDYCLLSDSLNFVQIKTAKEIDLSLISNCNDFYFNKLIPYHIPENTIINLFGSDVSKIKLSFEYFILTTKNIFVPNKSYIFLSGDKINNDQINNLFLSLLNAQEKFGFVKSYEKLDLAYKEFYYLKANRNPLCYYTLKLWWNFGYSKFRIFIISIILILIYSIVILTKGINYFLDYVYKIKNIKDGLHYLKSSTKPKIYRFFHKMGLIIFYVSFIFFGIRLDWEKLKFINIVPVLFIFFIYTTGLLCIGFIVNIIFS